MAELDRVERGLGGPRLERWRHRCGYSGDAVPGGGGSAIYVYRERGGELELPCVGGGRSLLSNSGMHLDNPAYELGVEMGHDELAPAAAAAPVAAAVPVPVAAARPAMPTARQPAARPGAFVAFEALAKDTRAKEHDAVKARGLMSPHALPTGNEQPYPKPLPLLMHLQKTPGPKNMMR